MMRAELKGRDRVFYRGEHVKKLDDNCIAELTVSIPQFKGGE